MLPPIEFKYVELLAFFLVHELVELHQRIVRRAKYKSYSNRPSRGIPARIVLLNECELISYPDKSASLSHPLLVRCDAGYLSAVLESDQSCLYVRFVSEVKSRRKEERI